MPRWRFAPVLSGGAGAGAAAIAIALGAGGHEVKSVPLSHFVSRISPTDNKVMLEPRELRMLVAWAQRVKSCLESGGTGVATPTVRNSEVVMRLRGVATKSERLRFAARSTRCAESAGGPPLHTSFQLQRDGAIHLYRPRACLLPVIR